MTKTLPAHFAERSHAVIASIWIKDINGAAYNVTVALEAQMSGHHMMNLTMHRGMKMLSSYGMIGKNKLDT